MKKINLFVFGVLIGFNILAHAVESSSEATNQFYNEMIVRLVQDRYLPRADSEEQNLVIRHLQNSIFMDELKEKTWPCLSKIQGLTFAKSGESNPTEMRGMRKSFENCISPVLYELDKKVWISIAEVKSGKEIDENNPTEEIEAMRMGSRIVASNSNARDSGILRTAQAAANQIAGIQTNPTYHTDSTNPKDGSAFVNFQNERVPMTESDTTMRAETVKIDLYALSLLNDISTQSNLCSNDSDNVNKTAANILKNPTCGVDLICQKDGSVLVNFKDKCTSIYGPSIQSDVSVGDVIKAVQKEIGTYHTITCQGHSCIWKKKE